MPRASQRLATAGLAVLANKPATTHMSWSAQLSTQLPNPVRVYGAAGTEQNDYPALGNFHRSDHSPAWFRGIPALFFTDTATFRNEHYHEATDLPETLDPTFHCGVSRLVVGAMAAYAEAP